MSLSCTASRNLGDMTWFKRSSHPAKHSVRILWKTQLRNCEEGSAGRQPRGSSVALASPASGAGRLRQRQNQQGQADPKGSWCRERRDYWHSLNSKEMQLGIIEKLLRKNLGMIVTSAFYLCGTLAFVQQFPIYILVLFMLTFPGDGVVI